MPHLGKTRRRRCKSRSRSRSGASHSRFVRDPNSTLPMAAQMFMKENPHLFPSTISTPTTTTNRRFICQDYPEKCDSSIRRFVKQV